MSRFKWNEPRNGRLINRYIDMICRDYPAIAKDIVKHGIGPLDNWFGGAPSHADGCTVGNAKCGCLVGTTALVAVERYKKTAEKVPAIKDYQDAATVLYKFLVEKSGRDVSKYVDNDRDYYDDEDYGYLNDPLYELIHDAGIAAASEIELSGEDYDSPDSDSLTKAREKRVIDRMEDRIRRNLNIPYPKQRKNASQTRV